MRTDKSLTAVPPPPESMRKRAKPVSHGKRVAAPRTMRSLFKFRLYVARGTQNSAQAGANLTTLCRTHLPDRHSIEVVDVLSEPKRALSDGIFMTPTLLKIAPSPTRKIVGTLSQPHTVLQALGLED